MKHKLYKYEYRTVILRDGRKKLSYEWYADANDAYFAGGCGLFVIKYKGNVIEYIEVDQFEDPEVAKQKRDGIFRKYRDICNNYESFNQYQFLKECE